MLKSRQRLGTRLAAVVQRAADLASAIEGAVVAYFQESPKRARVWQFLVAFDRHQSLRTASAMAFDLFLAIVPMLGLIGYAIARILHSQPLALLDESGLLSLAPVGFHDFIIRNLTAFAESDLAPIFVLSALWLSSSAFVTMIRVFEESFDCEPRSWFITRPLALGFAALCLSLVLVAATAGALVTWQGLDSDVRREQIGGLLGVAPDFLRDFEPIGALAFVIGFLGIAGYLAFIYRFSIVRKVRRRYFPGALVATAIGILSSFLFAYYAANLSNYALVYGGLAAIVVVLLWLWVWCTAILIGAEINMALEGAVPPSAESPTSERDGSPSHAAGGVPPQSARSVPSRVAGAPSQAAHGADVGPMHTPSAVGNPDGD